MEIDKDTARYIIIYFPHLLTDIEKLALRHSRSEMKLDRNSPNISTRINMYKRIGWLTDDKDVLRLLEFGYDNFEIKVAERILRESTDKVFLNICPNCKKLARTPDAKQCRFCGFDWH